MLACGRAVLRDTGPGPARHRGDTARGTMRPSALVTGVRAARPVVKATLRLAETAAGVRPSSWKLDSFLPPGFTRADFKTLDKPSRYLGNEFGAVIKDWDLSSIRFMLTYPETYELGASAHGHLVLYGILNKTHGVLCDRCYFPAEDMRALLRLRGLPLFALQSKRPLSAFDCLGFSLAYDLGITNILEMLSLSQLPMSWKERAEAEAAAAGGPDRPWNVGAGSTPLVFGGGPSATSNPEPFADFFDFFVLGDGEDVLPELATALQRCRAERLSRASTLLSLAKTVQGIYVPSLYDAPAGWGGAVFPIAEGVPPRVMRRVSPPDPFAQVGLVPSVGTIHDRLTVEIRRGCTRGCRFCQPGMLTRPARDVPPEAVIAAVEQGLKITGFDEVTLQSLSCSDYLALPAVGLELRNRLGSSVSMQLPSQRVDRFDDNIAMICGAGGGARRGSLTFAPEAGTQRMRDVINKGLTDDELTRGVETAWRNGWRQIKLYFMIGLPGETDADVVGIADTVKRLQGRGVRGHRGLSLTISNFTPKPHTPFQWHAVSSAELLRKQSLLKSALRGLAEVKANYTDVRMSAMEDFIGRGDRRLGAVMRRAHELGCLNAAWWEATEAAHAAWDRAIDEAGLQWKHRQIMAGEWDVLEVLGDPRFRGQGGGGRGRVDRGPLEEARLNAPLPWDVVDTGISKSWLKADLQRALEAATVSDCAHTVCSECGVCGDERGSNIVAPAPVVPALVPPRSVDDGADRVARIQVCLAKHGAGCFIGHLDTMRALGRALVRANIPVSTDRGLHPRPRLATALALPLGASSACELVEMDLSCAMDPGLLRDALTAALPPGMDALSAVCVPISRPDRKYAENVADRLVSYDALVAVTTTDGGASPADWRAWVDSIQTIASRAAAKLLTRIRLVALAGGGPNDSGAPRHERGQRMDLTPLLGELDGGQLPAGAAIMLVTGSAGPKGVMRADAVLALLTEVRGAGPTFQLLHLHRTAITLRPPSPVRIDAGFLLRLARDEGLAAALLANGSAVPGTSHAAIGTWLSDLGKAKGEAAAAAAVSAAARERPIKAAKLRDAKKRINRDR